MAHFREGSEVRTIGLFPKSCAYAHRSLDSKGVFWDGFKNVQSNLELRHYSSVGKFSADLGNAISSVIAYAPEINRTEAHAQVSGDPNGPASLSPEQRERKKLAKRIIKAVQGPLEEATRMEAELVGKPFEKELRELDAILEGSLRTHRASTSDLAYEGASDDETADQGRHQSMVPNDTLRKFEVEGAHDGGVDQHTSKRTPDDEHTDEAVIHLQLTNGEQTVGIKNDGIHADTDEHGLERSLQDSPHRPDVPAVPPTPPRSENEDLLVPLANGGIPWYLEPFDPQGTTIHDERWTGREVLRGMSEDLSEIDDEELNGMALESIAEEPGERGRVKDDGPTSAAAKRNKARARQRKQYW